MRLVSLARAGVLAAGMLTVSVAAAAAEYVEIWRTSGFKMPESAAFEPASGAFFISNINSPQFAPNGEGYVSLVDATGRIVTEKFVDGLNAPKGMDVAGNRLYVAGIEELVEIDIKTAFIVQRYKMPGAAFLNDVSVAPDGRVFVSETTQNALYVLEDGALKEWVKDASLAGINGVYVKGDTVYVALLGDISQGFQNVKPSNIKAIDLTSKTIRDYGSPNPVGVLDGLEPMPGGEGFMVTDNPGGKLL